MLKFIDITADIWPEVSDVVTKNHLEHEVIALASGVQYGELYELVYTTVSSTCCSYVVRDLNLDGKIIAADLSVDFANAYYKRFPVVGSIASYLAITYDLEDLYVSQCKKVPINYNEIFYKCFGFVDKSYSGNRILQKLMTLSISCAKKMGFKEVIAMATGEVSQHYASKIFNMKSVAKIAYQNYYFNHQFPFVKIVKPHFVTMERKEVF